ncbi:TRAP transporter substrate-binding protein DctP [Mesorhizobium sp. L-8-10]|uniref:TRAP transporter substrate-binding protein DctP n=1 Tax=Mesorhizobium sp. L-8-10 TaxID=2744523 RepID=UPI001926B47C|nr:TRAP transporter substrate-binding protein DctP [Mesorhizobium sp. L-8-10]
MAFAILSSLSAAAQAEAVTLRAISAFPANLEFTKQFQAFIDRVNRSAEGVVAIQFVGGPEVIPPQQQDTALRNGVFDMQMGPASYYNGTVPEADALFGATVSPVEARKNGATAMLNGIWREKLNAELIGWQSGDVPFYVYLVDEPKMAASGSLDLTGIQMRSTPAYREWFEALGGNNVMLQTSEMFTAFERGVVRGLGWPGISFTDIGVHKFLKYRVAPPVWQLDLVIMMNGAKWDGLSEEAKKVITEAAIVHEEQTQKDFAAIAENEAKILEQAGVQTVEVAEPAAHRKIAHDLVWTRLEGRDATHAAALREKLYAE